MDLDTAIRALTGTHAGLASWLLAAAAFLEYVFPPFPGDTVTLAGAVLVTGYGFPAWRLLAAVLLGGLAGAALDFAAGVAIARAIARARARGEAAPAWTRRRPVQALMRGADRVGAAFARHGEAYVAINRFLPGIRGFVFVAAGMSGMRIGRVLLWAVASSLAWNLLLLAAGMAVGTQVDRLEAAFREYGLLAWGALAIVAAVALARHRLRRRREARPPGGDGGGPGPV
jgi:membrane protein DedA with SNARE-associated domain